MKKATLLIIFLSGWFLQAQTDTLHNAKAVFAVKDSISYYPASTNPYYFKVSTPTTKLDTIYYRVDFSKSQLYLRPNFYKAFPTVDSLFINFYKYPQFLTQTYQELDPSIILDKMGNNNIVAYKAKKDLRGKPLEGLDTQGNIIRGVTIGNNQDAVLNSILDLRIEGQLSSKVKLRARINDTNIPIQENGYSQDLKDLDRVYIEMLGPQWSITAGDVFLKDTTHYFMHFNKKVSGVAVATHTDKWHSFASSALVRGRYTSFSFQGEEANQGPYKLTGSNGEAYIFIIKGSEKVFINGILQTSGIDKDYLIDYYTAEITFNPTKPITSDMRVKVEFQYSDRNYSRFVTYESVDYTGKKWNMGVSYFNESDLKNQALQVNLTDEQLQMLAEAGNTEQQLFVEQAEETAFIEDAILYKRTELSGKHIYEYSHDESETLYQVGFTYFGKNQGDYRVIEYLANGRKMEYVGENQGDYKALIPLVAPEKHQMIVVHSKYKPNNKTDFSIEMAYAEKDPNLFSKIDNEKNSAPALKTTWNQILIDSTQKKWQLESKIKFYYKKNNFQSIERLNEVEFNRNWNINLQEGNQRWLDAHLIFSHQTKSLFFYQFENLNFLQTYNGNRQSIGLEQQFNNINISHLSSYLESKANLINTQYLQSHSSINYSKKDYKFSSNINFENNLQKNPTTGELKQNSFRFIDIENILAVGDSAKMNIKLGVNFHRNDSLVNSQLQRVNDSKTAFINSQLINKENAHLNLYLNYRDIKYKTGANTGSLNSKLTYKQQLFNRFVVGNTQYQNTSGSVAKHEYTYVKTEVGQGFYTWIDYNENGVQDIDEFEIAQYADQANYLRIALPNINYLPTYKVNLQQSIQLNFSKLTSKKAYKKILSHWFNQMSLLAENNQYRVDNLLNLNPFDLENEQLVSKQFVLKNSLFFNRGLAKYSTIYSYIKSEQKTIQTYESQENSIESHQLSFIHNIQNNWQLGLEVYNSISTSINELFLNRNYRISEKSFKPNLSYFFSKNHWVKINYSQSYKNNKIGGLESLNQYTLALKYQYSGKENTHISAELKAIKNQFSGSSLSAIGYKMLEGLQPDNNMTWNLLWSNKLNSFLYLNINYTGRSNSFTRTIHNGNVQLRANF